jgi:hypothetical protein
MKETLKCLETRSKVIALCPECNIGPFQPGLTNIHIYFMLIGRQDTMFSVWEWYQMRYSANVSVIRTCTSFSLFTGKQIIMIRGSVNRACCLTLSLLTNLIHIIKSTVFNVYRSISMGRELGI